MWCSLLVVHFMFVKCCKAIHSFGLLFQYLKGPSQNCPPAISKKRSRYPTHTASLLFTILAHPPSTSLDPFRLIRRIVLVVQVFSWSCRWAVLRNTLTVFFLIPDLDLVMNDGGLGWIQGWRTAKPRCTKEIGKRKRNGALAARQLRGKSSVAGEQGQRRPFTRSLAALGMVDLHVPKEELYELVWLIHFWVTLDF